MHYRTLAAATAAVAAALTLTGCDPSIQATAVPEQLQIEGCDEGTYTVDVKAGTAECVKDGLPIRRVWLSTDTAYPDLVRQYQEIIAQDENGDSPLFDGLGDGIFTDEPQRLDGDEEADAFRCAVDSPPHLCEMVLPGDPRYDAAPPMGSEPATNPITIDWEEAMAELEGATR